VTLSLLGITVLVACGNEPQVVAPVEPDPPVGASSLPPDAPSSDQTGLGTSATTSSTAVVSDGAPVTDTPPSSTTTVPAPDPTPPSSVDPDQPYQGAAEESLAFVNQMRAENGRDPLQVDPELTVMADNWADQIATDQNLRHNPNLGEQAPDDYRAVGENVGYARSSSSIDNGWWDSEGHRENILRSSFDAIGIAFVVDEDGTYWGVQVFAGG
jgi:uncharacterized protein YkwD